MRRKEETSQRRKTDFKEEREGKQEESLSRRSGRKHEQVSGCKTLQENLHSLCFTPSLSKPEIGKKFGR